MTEKREIVSLALPLIAAAAACTPAPAGTTLGGRDQPADNAYSGVASAQSTRPDSATVGPIPEAVPVTENRLPGRADTPAEALGRRTLSTAFVQVGPEGYLSVELKGGRIVVLRNVVMRPNDYCGTHALGASAGKKFCGGYADVAGARAGGGPNSDPAAQPAPGRP